MVSEPRIYTFVKGESQGGKDMKHLVRSPLSLSVCDGGGARACALGGREGRVRAAPP